MHVHCKLFDAIQRCKRKSDKNYLLININELFCHKHLVVYSTMSLLFGGYKMDSKFM